MKLKVKILAVFLVTGLTVLAQSRTVTGEIPDSGKSLKTNSVEEVVKAMTLEEKVGQMFLVCVSSSTASKDDIAAYHPGGYLFFADFFKSRDWEWVPLISVTAWVFRRQFWMTGRQVCGYLSNGKATNVPIIVRHFLRQRLWRLRGIRN